MDGLLGVGMSCLIVRQWIIPENFPTFSTRKISGKINLEVPEILQTRFINKKKIQNKFRVKTKTMKCVHDIIYYI